MTITLGDAVPYFDNPATENQDGSTFIQRFRVPLFGVDTADAKERSLIEGRAKRANGLPQYGHQYEGNSAAFCQNITANVISGQENNTPTHVIVACTFSTKPVDKRDEEEDPLEKRPDIIWSTHFEREAVLNAHERVEFQNGSALGPVVCGSRNTITGEVNGFNQFSLGIINSAGQPFTPSPEKDIPFPMVTVIQNISRDDWDPVQNKLFIGTRNITDFKIDGVTIKRREGKLLDRVARTMYQGKLSYREVTTTILIKANHDLILQDRGFITIGIPTTPGNPSDPSPVFGGDQNTVPNNIKVDGNNSPEEILLDGLGNLNPKEKSPVYIHYNFDDDQNFTLLRLPQDKQ